PGLGTNTCWQSAREAFLEAVSDCRATNGAPSNCVRIAVQELIADFAECRGESLGRGNGHPGRNNEFRECIEDAREAFTSSWQQWQTNNVGNPDPTQGILAAVEAFREQLGECLGEPGLGTNTCWQSA